MRISFGPLLVFFIFLMCGCTQEKSTSPLKELYRQARAFSTENPEKALRIIEAHNELARATKEKSQLGDGYFLKAWIYERKTDQENALVHYFNALLQYRDAGNRQLEAVVSKNIGRLFYLAKGYELSIDYYNEALKTAIQLQDKNEIASNYYNLGLSYKQLAKYDSSAYYQLKSLDIRKDIDDVAGQAKVLNEMGIVSHEVGNFQDALDYYEKVRLMIEGDSNQLVLYSRITNNIGNTLLATNKLEEAKAWIRKGFDLMKLTANTRDFTVAFNNLGLIYIKEGKQDSARLFFSRSIAANMDYHNSEEIVISWGNLKEIFNSAGQLDSAYYYSSLINEITLPVFQRRDDLIIDSQKYRMELINADYLNKQIRKVDARKRLVLIFVFVIVIISLVLMATTWYFYIKRKGLKESSILKYLPENLRFRMELLLYENEEYKKTIEEMRRTRKQAQMRVNK